MSFTNFSTGNGHSFGGEYLEIDQNKFLKYSDKFDDPNLPGEMVTSVWSLRNLGIVAPGAANSGRSTWSCICILLGDKQATR